MISYFVYIIIGAAIIGLIEAISESKDSKVTVEKLFYNSPDTNAQIIRSRSFFRSLISNAALVFLVLVLYWLCL
jgi:hypothetical protein